MLCLLVKLPPSGRALVRHHVFHQEKTLHLQRRQSLAKAVVQIVPDALLLAVGDFHQSNFNRRRSVMSSLSATKCVMVPCSSWIGAITTNSQNSVPSFFRLQSSPRQSRPAVMVAHISL